MEIAIVIFRQILTMGLYMLVGFFLYKRGKITDEGSKTIASILLWLVIPATIINSFLTEFSTAKLKIFGMSFLVGVMAILLSMLIARIVFRGRPVEIFGASFSNAGFIGIPLVQESLGEEAVFMLVGMIVGLNIAQWTYGAAILKGERTTDNPKQMLFNPITISSIVGFVLFVSSMGTCLPRVVDGFIDGISGLNAPLAMLVLGVYLAQTSLKSLVTTIDLYKVSFVRLFFIPAIILALLYVFPIDIQIKLTILIGASAPVGANVAVYSQLYNQDYKYACKSVAQSTVLSIITLPLVIFTASLLWNY